MATKKAAKAAPKRAAAPKAPKIESTFEKGGEVVQVISGAGFKTCTTGWRVSAITKDGVEIEDDNGNDCSLRYDLRSGMEILPAIPGFYSEIIRVES